MRVAALAFQAASAIWFNSNYDGGANAQYVSGRIEEGEIVDSEELNCFYPGIEGRPINPDGSDGKRRNLREGQTTEHASEKSDQVESETLEEQMQGERKLEKPKPILTFWKCGNACKRRLQPQDAAEADICKCKCTISRIVDLNTIPAGQAVAMDIGEYSTESACNANCGRGEDDFCWVCVDAQVFPAGHMVRQCKHVQDTWITGPLKKQGIQCCPPLQQPALVEKYCFP